jgi:CBS domain-containing protein
MVSELVDIQNFLSRYQPFSGLSQGALSYVSQNLEISYFRSGSAILEYGEEIHHLYIVRSGVVEAYRRNGDLYHLLDQGDIFGHIGLLMNNRVRFPAKAVTDTLIYCLPESDFFKLCNDHGSFADFVEVDETARLRQAVIATEGNTLTTLQVNALLTRDVVSIERRETIQKAAQAMKNENISAILITDSERRKKGDNPGFVGVVTDRDLCTKVLASGLSSDTPVEEVMTTELLWLDHKAFVFEAMLVMLRKNVHHLPILRGKTIIGILEMTDIVRYESQSSLLLVRTIFIQNSIEELAAMSTQVKNCFTRMVNEGGNSRMIGSAMAVIGRSFIQRLAELAEKKYGPPPVSYCILILGSMARDEQLIVTDQDNALILDEAYDPKQHGEYFARFVAFICDGLAACGYDYCTGHIMATNQKWQKTLSQWQECFADWIDNPQPEALLNSSIFFDLDGVCGHTEWADQLRTFICERTKENGKFLACIARNALNRTPPLGFFKNFVMEKDGQQNKSINLKRRGTAPLADLIRVHALAVGTRAQNSFARLDDIIQAGILPTGRGPDLRDTMEFISMVRIRHQAISIVSGIKPDNNIDPEKMSDFERRNLKDAFQVLSNAQNFLKYKYSASQL